jgi:hypothetical protein
MVSQWEYLEVILDLSKKTWKDSEVRRGKLRKNSVALALNELGIEGWELAAALTENSSGHRLLFKRPWPSGGENGADDDVGDDDISQPLAGATTGY